ncbi:DJ-1/PfpI family protein [Pseudomonas sp. NPDC087342]|uniref:DJ-1/PfpI family protein n=1 Tax=Pseudomonas sp. NPDC087342 TaxID=3364437 RepID=UPI003829BFD9
MITLFSPVSPLRIQIVLFNGFDLLDAIAPYEVFLAAADATEGALRVSFVTAEGAREVPCGISKLLIPAEGVLSLDSADIVLLPGAAGKTSGSSSESIPFLLNQAAQTDINSIMREALAHPDITVATVCGGSLVLAMAGLIEKRNAVTHHLGMPVLESLGVYPITARVVDDGDLISSGGVTSGLDLALYLVERFLGPRIAHDIERLFEYERRGTPWRALGMLPALAEPENEKERNDLRVKAITLPSAIDSISKYSGDWDTVINTPVGALKIKLFIAIKNGTIQGTASHENEVIPFNEIYFSDDQLRWTQQITKPMKLNLKFAVRVKLNDMTGTVKAGLLPASKLLGKRIIN